MVAYWQDPWLYQLEDYFRSHLLSDFYANRDPVDAVGKGFDATRVRSESEQLSYRQQTA